MIRTTTKRILNATAMLSALLLTSGVATAAPEPTEVCVESNFDLPPTCYENEDVRDDMDGGQGLWTVVGSAGIVDEVSRSIYAFVKSHAHVKPSKTGTVILRYPVDCKALDDASGYTIMYRDDGDAARVRAKLVVSTLLGTDTFTVADFDSDTRPSSGRVQTFVGGIEDLNFETGDACNAFAAYWEVRIGRGLDGGPRLAMLGLRSK